MEQCRLFQLHVDFPTIDTDCGGNVAKLSTAPLNGIGSAVDAISYTMFVKAGLDSLKNHELNPAQTMAATLQEALDRSLVLSFHCIVAQMI